MIQFNEVSDHKAPWDAQGFDSDWNCRRTLIQYNYSHDNEGFELLLSEVALADGGALASALGLQGAALAAADTLLQRRLDRGPLCRPGRRPARCPGGRPTDSRGRRCRSPRPRRDRRASRWLA